MDITSQIKEYVMKERGSIETATLTYEDYIRTELGVMPSEGSESYEPDDSVSVVAWVNSSNGVQDLICATLSGNLSHGVQMRYKDGTYTKLHTHNYIELAYVVCGRLIQRIMGKSEIFSEGEICLIDRESIHADLLLWEDATVLFIGLDSVFFDQFLHMDKVTSETEYRIRQLIARRKSEYSFVRFSPIDKGQQTKRTFELILEELLQTYPLKTHIVKGYVERILLLLQVEYRFVLTRKEQNELTKALFQSMEEYIEENYTTICVQKVASLFNYNSDYISRLCFKRTGMTLSNYILKIRMKKALSLLETTNLPIDQIAEQVGYSNIGFFYRKFREEFQTTPNNIRKSIL